MGGEGLKLVWCRDKVEAGDLGDGFRNRDIEALLRVEARPDRGAALGEHRQARDHIVDPLDAKAELLDVAGELLPEGQRGSVLDDSVCAVSAGEQRRQ